MTSLLSQATLWGLAAAIPAVTAEYLYRVLPGPWWTHLYLWVPIQMTIGYGIYRMVTASPNLLDAFIVWNVATTGMRVFVTLVVLRDDVAFGTWVALILVMLAKGAQTWLGR